MSQIARPKSFTAREIIKSDEMNAQFDTIYEAFNLLESNKLVTDQGYATRINDIDLNELKVTGFYAGTNYTNAPTPYFYRIIASYDAENSGFQLAMNNKHELYIRMLNGGTWQDWTKMSKDERGSWTNITAKNTWKSNTSNPAKYRINGDRVELRGMLESGTTKKDDTIIFTLPTEARPKSGSRGFSSPCTSSPYVSYLNVGTDGNMKIRGVAATSSSASIRLDGIYFDIN